MKPSVILTLALVLCSSCFLRARRAARLEGRYAIEVSAYGWHTVNPGGADRAWRNDAVSATLYTDSNCGMRFQDLPLERLLHHQLAGLKDSVLLSEDWGQLDGRESLTVRYQGMMDGVPTGLGLTVLKKGQCVYDFVLVGPPVQMEVSWPDYRSMLATFRTES